MDTIRISLLHSKYHISYNKNCISHFCYLSKVNTSLKSRICFENIYIFPLNLLSSVQKALKNIQTKFHWDRMKHKHFIEVSNICPTITLKSMFVLRVIGSKTVLTHRRLLTVATLNAGFYGPFNLRSFIRFCFSTCSVFLHTDIQIIWTKQLLISLVHDYFLWCH